MRAWRSIAAGVLTLIGIQVFVSGRGPEAGGQLLTWIDTGLRAAISPKVAAIPTRKTAGTTTPAPGKSSDDWKNGPIGLPTNPSVTTVTV